MSTDLRHTLGASGEALAVLHLQRLGYTVLARNHRTRFGELDIVACHGDVLVFVEVKSRRQSQESSPWDALHARKQVQVRRMAAAYLSQVQDRPHVREIRFDAIGVIFDGRGRMVALDHLEAAF